LLYPPTQTILGAVEFHRNLELQLNVFAVNDELDHNLEILVESIFLAFSDPHLIEPGPRSRWPQACPDPQSMGK
jgi:hypothetical protein